METAVQPIKSKRFDDTFPRKVVLGLGILAIIIGFIYTPDFSTLLEGLKNLGIAHMRTDSEPLVIAGNFGSVWLNAGLIMVLMWLTHKVFDSRFKGVDYAIFLMMFGLTFYGVTLFNVWAPLIGSLVANSMRPGDMKDKIGISWFGPGVGSLVSNLAFFVPQLDPASMKAILISQLVGFMMGFLIPHFIDVAKEIHKGRTIYNVGFAAALTGFAVYTLLKALGLTFLPVDDQVYLEASSNIHLFLVLIIVPLYLFVMGAIYNGGIAYYFKNVFWITTDGGDYSQLFGPGAALMNQAVVLTFGLIIATFVLPDSTMSGAVIAACFTAGAFASLGVTVRGATPVVLGSMLGAFFFGGVNTVINGGSFLNGGYTYMNGRAMTVAMIQVMGASPVTSRDGKLSAFVFGVIHQALVVNLGVLHGWTVVYNNAFSQGLVASIFKPLWYPFSKEKNK